MNMYSTVAVEKPPLALEEGAVLWLDYDAVIADTLAMVDKALWETFCDDLNLPPEDARYILLNAVKTHGCSGRYIACLEGYRPDSPEFEGRVREIYEAYSRRVIERIPDSLPPNPELAEHLDRLKGKYRFGALSNGMRHYVLAGTDFLGLTPHFHDPSLIIGRDCYGFNYTKHDPAPYALCRQRLAALGLKPTRMLLVDDSLGNRDQTLREGWGFVHIHLGNPHHGVPHAFASLNAFLRTLD